MYLHFDKPYYSAGDVIWFKAYVVEAYLNQPTTLSKIVYVDFISPSSEILASRTLKIENGGAAGDISIPATLVSGKYRVRAYTSYMRNFDNAFFFRKELVISGFEDESKKKEKVQKSKLALNFFPEGGNMVVNLSSKIGFKALEVEGKGVSISGKIINQDEKVITNFQTSKFGMGSFNLIPKQGERYKAEVFYKGKRHVYDLQESLDKGVVMKVIEEEEHFKIQLQSNLKEGVKNVSIVGKQRNEIVCTADIKFIKRKVGVPILKERLKEGIVQFTVLDKDGKPICERLVFVEKKELEPKVAMKPRKDSYGIRELVTVNLNLEKEIDSLPKTAMSVSVTDVSVVDKEIHGLTIKSHLLLNSVLKGEIESPNYYFESDDPKRKQLLDELLLTQGWRRYLWNMPEIESTETLKYEIEKGITISGSVHKYFNSKQTIESKVSLTAVHATGISSYEKDTDTNGKFTFGPYNISDTTKVILQAKEINNKKKRPKRVNNYTVVLNSNDFPNITAIVKKATSPIITTEINSNYKQRSYKMNQMDVVLKLEKEVNLLDEIELKSVKNKLEQLKDNKRVMGKEHNAYTVSFQDLVYIPPNPLEALYASLPGIIIDRKGIILRQSGLPRYAGILLDGMPIAIEDIGVISSADIDFIDVIKEPYSYIYRNGGSGIVAIYTKDGETEAFLAQEKLNNNKTREIALHVHPGYYQAKEFYSPVYTSVSPDTNKPDYRSTIFWSPIIKLNEKGEGIISFYSSDITTSYRVDLQGLTYNGIPFTKEIFIEIGNFE